MCYEQKVYDEALIVWLQHNTIWYSQVWFVHYFYFLFNALPYKVTILNVTKNVYHLEIWLKNSLKFLLLFIFILLKRVSGKAYFRFSVCCCIIQTEICLNVQNIITFSFMKDFIAMGNSTIRIKAWIYLMFPFTTFPLVSNQK